MELTTSSTPSFGSGAATMVSSSSARTVWARGGGGAFHEGWGFGALDQLGFFGQFLDMCPCCLQKKCQGLTGPCARREQVWFSKGLAKQDPIKVEIKPRRIVFNKSSLATIVLR